jgi:hypothetical protein
MKCLIAPAALTLALAVLTLAASTVLAVPVETRRVDNTALGYGTVITAKALTSDRYTATESGRWINVSDVRAVAFDISLTDADSSCTAITMTCEVSTEVVTTNDAGFEYQAPMTCSGGACVYVQKTWCKGTAAACGLGSGSAPGSRKWTWMVDSIPGPYLNCLFHAAGTPAGTDLLTVVARGLTP